MSQDRDIMKRVSPSGDFSPVEQKVIERANKPAISSLSDDELMEQVTNLVSGISSMVGLKQVSRNEITLFVDFLRKYYKDLTISEVKLAFEYSVIGELDNYLPKDRNGEANKHHFQMLSMDYVSRILNAYKKLRSQVKIKVHKSESMKGLKSGESAKNEQINKRYLVASFERYFKNEEVPEFVVPHVYTRYLYEAGLLDSMPEVTEADKKEVWKRIMNNKSMRQGSREKFQEKLNRKSQRNASYRAIIQVFDKLIENGDHLRNYFDV